MASKDKFPLSKTPFLRTRKSRIIAASACFLAVCAFGAAGVAPLPDDTSIPVRNIVQEIGLPSIAQQMEALQEQSPHYFHSEKIRSGDTLSSLLYRLGVEDEAAASFIKSDAVARTLLRLKPGVSVDAQTDADGALQQLTVLAGDGRSGQPVKMMTISRDGDNFHANETLATLERRVEMRAGEIRSSLFAATDAAQVPDRIASQIIDIFSTEIDFAADLRRGDRFNVVYETFWRNGELVSAGRILAAEFINAGSAHQSVWLDAPDGAQGGSYYSIDGKSLKKAFLRSPLEFSRISSGFSMRVHPISGHWKAHKGVDFAAPIGTPIRAAGDGIVDFMGRQNGYGNVVVLKHWSHYSTAYAHMSRFSPALKRGAKISQGDVIGYVGTTGWSTGPHLHYEFRVDNQPRDPLSVDMPNAQPLAGAAQQRFNAVAAEMRHRFALLDADANPVKVASR